MLWWTLWRLRSKDPKTRLHHVQNLTYRLKYAGPRDPRAVRALLTVARSDADAEVRRSALRALGQVGGSEAVAALTAAAREHGDAAALDALAKSDDAGAAAALAGLLTDPKAGPHRPAVAAALQARNCQHSLTALAAALARDTDDQVRLTAAQTLARSGNRRFLKPLAEALRKDASAPVRRAAVEALGAFPGEPVGPVLEAALRGDRDAGVKAEAAVALDRVNPQWTASEAAREGLADLCPSLAKGQGRHGPVVLKILQGLEPNWRPGGKAVAGVPFLADLAAAAPDGTIREAARTALTRLAPDWLRTKAARPLIPALVRLAQAHNWGQALAETEALLGRIDPGWRQDPEACDHGAELLATLRDRPTREAIWALGFLQDARAVTDLIELLLGKGPHRNRQADLCAKAAAALGAIGDAAAVEPLTTMYRLFASLASRGYSVGHQGQVEDGHDANRAIDTAQAMISALTLVLEKSAAGTGQEELRQAARLDNVTWYVSRPSCQGASGQESIDCSAAKQLARQELIRRGLTE